MKSRTLYLAVLFGMSCVAQAAELSSFDEVRSQYQSYKDPTRVSYLYNRCAALQLNVAAIFARKGQSKAAQDFESLAQHYMVLSEANEREIDRRRGLKSKDTMKTVQRNVATVSEVYSKRLKANFAQRGDYVLGDAQLETELNECVAVEVFVKKAISGS
jgi:hypothetical protein